MVSSHDAGKVHHRAVNACLFPLYACEGTHVVTVEGLGTRRSGLHPVQRAIAEAHGSQCGFCTPGFVMSMYALLRSSAGRPTRAEIEEAVGGNLCRCTGYRPILAGFARSPRAPPPPPRDETLRGGASPSKVSAGGRAGGCGARRGDGCDGCDAVAGASEDVIPTCPSTGFPCGVRLRRRYPRRSRASRLRARRVHVRARADLPPRTQTPRRARTLPARRERHPAPPDDPRAPSRVEEDPTRGETGQSGNTEVGVEVKFKHARYRTLIAPTHVPELTIFEVDEETRGGFVRVGAATTLSTLERRFRDAESTLAPSRVETLRATRNNFVGSPGRRYATSRPWVETRARRRRYRI